MTVGHVRCATTPLQLVPDSLWFRAGWQRHLWQQGHRWVAAFMAPKHAVGDMQPRGLCTNPSHNQYILQLIQRRACVPESLPVCLFGFSNTTSSFCRRGTCPINLVSFIFWTTLATLPPKFKVSGLKWTLVTQQLVTPELLDTLCVSSVCPLSHEWVSSVLTLVGHAESWLFTCGSTYTWCHCIKRQKPSLEAFAVGVQF